MFDFNALANRKFILFGAGNEGICAVDILRKNEIEPLCFCDNYKQGEKAGLPIISTAELSKNHRDALILITAIGYADEIILELKNLGIKDDNIISDFRVHLYKQPYLAYFELNIVDHCNISCLGCSHFSPIAEERVSSLESIKSDLQRMSELTAQNVDEIHILGGEPLLHPKLNEILTTSRELFPKSVLSVITNGASLLKQDSSFWDTCKLNDITIEVTKYPVNMDYDKIVKTVEEKGIKFKFHSYTGKKQKTLYKMPLDLNGSQSPETSFRNCTLANRWIALMDGKMYTCQVSPNVSHFNKKFDENLDLQDGDFIDIYKAKDIDEILTFLSTPKPFCKYCNIDGIINGIPWQSSKRKISEWT